MTYSIDDIGKRGRWIKTAEELAEYITRKRLGRSSGYDQALTMVTRRRPQDDGRKVTRIGAKACRGGSFKLCFSPSQTLQHFVHYIKHIVD